MSGAGISYSRWIASNAATNGDEVKLTSFMTSGDDRRASFANSQGGHVIAFEAEGQEGALAVPGEGEGGPRAIQGKLFDLRGFAGAAEPWLFEGVEAEVEEPEEVVLLFCPSMEKHHPLVIFDKEGQGAFPQRIQSFHEPIFAGFAGPSP